MVPSCLCIITIFFTWGDEGSWPMDDQRQSWWWRQWSRAGIQQNTALGRWICITEIEFLNSRRRILLIALELHKMRAERWRSINTFFAGASWTLTQHLTLSVNNNLHFSSSKSPPRRHIYFYLPAPNNTSHCHACPALIWGIARVRGVKFFAAGILSSVRWQIVSVTHSESYHITWPSSLTRSMSTRVAAAVIENGITSRGKQRRWGRGRSKDKTQRERHCAEVVQKCAQICLALMVISQFGLSFESLIGIIFNG